MRLSDALRFSRTRRAQHPVEGGFPVIGSDYGIQCGSIRHMIRLALAGSNAQIDGDTIAWSEMAPQQRRHLLHSEEWEPIDEKSAMMVIAEAASDWTTIEEPPDDTADDEEEDFYYL